HISSRRASHVCFSAGDHMRICIAAAAAALALSLVGGTARGQTTQPATDERMNRFEQRLDDMEKRHQAELQARDQEIARLRDELARRAPTTAPSASQPDEIEKTKQDNLKDI